MVPMRRNSPLTGRPWISSIIFLDRSPWATEVMTRPTSVVGWARLSMSVLMESTLVAHRPAPLRSEARSVSLPSSPTILLTRDDLVGHALVLLDDVVKRRGDLAQNAVAPRGHADGKVALLDGAEGQQQRLQPGRQVAAVGGTAIFGTACAIGIFKKDGPTRFARRVKVRHENRSYPFFPPAGTAWARTALAIFSYALPTPLRGA